MAQAHLVGSMPFDDAEPVFKVVAENAGDSIKRFPDGETGPRDNWIFSMIPRMAATPGLEFVTEIKDFAYQAAVDTGYEGMPQFGIREGVAPEDVGFDLGYDTDGIAAWPAFKRLRDEGVIGSDVKFQLAIPTPMAILGSYIVEDQRALLFAPYQARLKTEIENILKTIPAKDLAIQWDVAAEFGLMEGAFGEHPLTDDFIIATVVGLSALVPAEVDMGYHFCYGDAPAEEGAKGRHFKEPEDAALLTRVANAIFDGASRSVEFIHMPVPIGRDDDAFFKPLEDLKLRPETELYLGLVHEEDGLAGAQKRIATARKHVNGPFGVATECGLQNEPTDQIPALIQLHRDIEVPS